MVTLEQIRERIKQARESKNMRPKDLGELMGVSGRTISRWEDGTRGIELSVLLQIAAVLEVEPAFFLSTGEKKQATDPALPKEAIKLITIYDNLNDDGKKHLIECAENASEVSRYKKSISQAIA